MSEQQAGQQSQTVAEALVAAVRRSARYNPDVESAPHCILWTDREQQWQSVIPALQGDFPDLDHDRFLFRRERRVHRLQTGVPSLAVCNQARPGKVVRALPRRGR
ncbi:hypothetical protein [Thioalkalivibrio sp. ALE23]|uniref:hypothetical protein n=1 Tax=Thioalkalivibrio sp. ALE23 TaxID=1265495 RepID=UPI001E29284F|nr:hypothetical protein [Thioalkalivibrio sp. ALE23]